MFKKKFMAIVVVIAISISICVPAVTLAEDVPVVVESAAVEEQQPSAVPSMEPSPTPNEQPGAAPSNEPSPESSVQPSEEPSMQPSAESSGQPSVESSMQPSMEPDEVTSEEPNAMPSATTSVEPSAMPNEESSMVMLASGEVQVTDEASLIDAVNAVNAGTANKIVFMNEVDITSEIPAITGTCLITSTEGDRQAMYRDKAGNAYRKRLLEVGVNGNVSIENFVIHGYGEVSKADEPAVVVVGGGVLTLGAGGAIAQNDNVNGTIAGGGVSVTKGTLNIKDGGSIESCKAEIGAGVFLGDEHNDAQPIEDAVLVMQEGRITKNQAVSAAGVCLWAGKLTMNHQDALITGNTAVAWGGGIRMLTGAADLQAGSISNNCATDLGGAIYTEYGEIGIENGMVFSGNTAQRGAVLYANGDTNITMNGGVVQDNVSATSVIDFGRSMPSSTFTMNGGSIGAQGIGNTGIPVNVWVGTFEMNGGSIVENVSPSAASAIAVGSGGQVILKGGSITNNLTKSSDGAVNIVENSNGLQSSISGGVVIQGNTANGRLCNLVLMTDAVVDIAGALTGKIGVTTADKPTQDVKATFARAAAGYTLKQSDVSAFQSDDAKYYIAEYASGDSEVKLAALAQQFTVTASAGSGGVISPSGAVAVTKGQAQTFTMTPFAGYMLRDVLIDGKSVGKVNRYTFSDVSANHTIHVTFEAGTVPVESIQITPPAAPTEVGKTAQIKAVIYPSFATNQSLEWKSSDPNVATVDAQGRVSARQAGTAIITATATDGSNVSAQCSILTYRNKPVESVVIAPTTVQIGVGRRLTLHASVMPGGATNKALRWKSNNSKVVMVNSNGTIKGLRPGTAVITAKAMDGSGKMAKCRIYVTKGLTYVRELRLNRTALTLKAYEGKTQLKVGILPSDATSKTLIWRSSDVRVATVNQRGRVTAQKSGVAYITAYAADGSGVQATCKVLVK